jgi:hypothetical protein
MRLFSSLRHHETDYHIKGKSQQKLLAYYIFSNYVVITYRKVYQNERSCKKVTLLQYLNSVEMQFLIT